VDRCQLEEVFVFTNKISSAMHLYYNSLRGSVNKSSGNAFLITWLLDSKADINRASGGRDNIKSLLMTKQHSYLSSDNQADNALFSVLQTCTELYHDKFYVENMSENAKKWFRDKMSKRPRPLV